MPPRRGKKKEKVIWDDNDCKADICLRPPGTSRWVCCDCCTGWFHVPCLFLSDELLASLDTEKEFYCPACVVVKSQEFDRVRERLTVAVEDLATRQSEFGGVTIARDMFIEKKNANAYNYSQDFPPTLRDLVARVRGKHKTLGDFKWDYKQLVSRLGPQLRKEHEDRLQIIEWELDELAEQILKPEPPQESETELEFDLEKVKQESDQDQETSESSRICCHCQSKLTIVAYICLRKHLVCMACRKKNPGCICPECQDTYGDRKRLSLWDGEEVDTVRKRGKKSSPKSALISLGLAKRRVQVEDVSAIRRSLDDTPSPQILNVWSCTEENTHTILQSQVCNVIEEPTMGEISLEGPAIKEEPVFLPTDVQHQFQTQPESQPEVGGHQLNMASVLTEPMSNQLLELIDSHLFGEAGGSTEEQQPTNYNDTPPTVDLGINFCLGLTESVTQVANNHEVEGVINTGMVSREALLMERRENLSTLLLMPRSEQVDQEIARVSRDIKALRQEVQQEEEQHEVLDPWAALQRVQQHGQTRSRDQGEQVNTIWSQYKGRSLSQGPPPLTYHGTSHSTPSNVQSPSVVPKPIIPSRPPVIQHVPYSIFPPADPQDSVFSPNAPCPLRGCRLEMISLGSRELKYSGELSFTLMKEYTGSALQWRTFLQLGIGAEAATNPLYQFQVGRAGHVFYIRALTHRQDRCGHRWQMELRSEVSTPISLGGEFSMSGPPCVLPMDIRPGDVREYNIKVVMA